LKGKQVERRVWMRIRTREQPSRILHIVVSVRRKVSQRTEVAV
jgi:hypothetical protein